MNRNKCLICKSKNFVVELINLQFSNYYINKFLSSYYSINAYKKIKIELNNFYYKILKCNNCHFIWQKHIPKEIFMKNLYEKFIDKKKSLQKSIDKHKRSKLIDQIQIDQIIYLLGKSRKIKVLDYGAGWGHWGINVQSKNIDITCLEYSKSRINYIKKLKLKTLKLKNSNQKFDFIRCEQVLEHLTDLNDVIKSLFSMLNKKGIIYISVPNGNKIINSEKFSNEFIKKGPVQPLEHLNCFNNFSLNKILEINRFKKISIIKLIIAKLYSNKLSFKKIKSILKDIYNYYYGTALLYYKD